MWQKIFEIVPGASRVVDLERLLHPVPLLALKNNGRHVYVSSCPEAVMCNTSFWMTHFTWLRYKDFSAEVPVTDMPWIYRPNEKLGLRLMGHRDPEQRQSQAKIVLRGYALSEGAQEETVWRKNFRLLPKHTYLLLDRGTAILALRRPW